MLGLPLSLKTILFDLKEEINGGTLIIVKNDSMFIHNDCPG